MGETVVLHHVSTHDLRDGDVVLEHGMRVRITGDGHVSQSHRTGEASPTLWWEGEVENLAEVLAAGFVPRSFIEDGRWGVQGNGLATWTVERSPNVPTETPDWVRVIREAHGQCRWFAICPNVATGVRSHPIIGSVATCDRHQHDL